MLAMMLFLLGQTATLVDAKDPGNLGEELFYASSAASGGRLCDRDRAARYSRQFEGRYGKRIRALVSYHESKFGRDPDFIFTSSCLLSRTSGLQQNRDHARAMDRLEAALQELEQRYGPPRVRAH